MSLDRDLLPGLLAWQLGFLTHEALVTGTRTWAADRDKSLAQVLAEQGVLPAPRSALLEALAREVPDWGPGQCLEAARSLSPLLDELRQVVTPAGAVPPTLSTCLVPIPDPHSTRVVSEAAPPAGTGTTGVGTSSDRRFLIVRLIGRGGIGEVFVARDEELRRDVALKQIQGQHAADPRSRARFLREAEVTGGLEHPGIVPVHGLGTGPDGRPFYAMRLIRGHTLKEGIERFHQTDWKGRPEGERTLAFRELLDRFLDLCNAMAYAHSKGVLHRDLKPGNVMLGKYGETLVVDWGLAKVMDQADTDTIESRLAVSAGDSGLTQAGRALGTPAYMSPEQAAGRLDRVGPRSDVYGLGATLYHLLTNQAPFPQGGLEEILPRVERGDFPPPRRLNRTAPAALEAVCLKAMARVPTDRYESPQALATEIEQWLADEPVSAYREPWRMRARRFVRRHRAAVLGGVATLVVAAVSLAVATALLSAKNEELTQANARAQAAREQAQQNFELATQAVADYLTGVADNDRLREQDLDKLRAELLRSAAAFYQRFAGRQDAPKYQSLGAEANIALARIHALLGEPREAAARLEQAVAALQPLAREGTEGRLHRERLTHAYLELAGLRRGMSFFPEAAEAARDALEHARALRAAFPDGHKPRVYEALAHRMLGLVFEDTQRFADAEKEQLEGRRLQQQLLQHFSDRESRLNLVQHHQNVGSLYGRMQRYPDAESAYREALAALEPLLKEHAKLPSIRDGHGCVQAQLADVMMRSGRSEEAERWFRAGLQTRERLAADFPMIPSYRSNVVVSLNDLTRFLNWQGRLEEEEAAARHWVEVAEKLTTDFPNIVSFRLYLAQSYYSLGRAVSKRGDKKESARQRRKSIDVLTKLVQAYPGTPGYRLELSICHNGLAFVLIAQGRHAQAKLELEKALQIMQKLVAEHPTVPDYQFRLGQTLMNLGNVVKVGEVGKSLAYAREAVGVLEKLAATTSDIEHHSWLGAARSTLGLNLWAAGQAQEGRKEVNQAIAIQEAVLRKDVRLGNAVQRLREAHWVRTRVLAGLRGDHEAVVTGDRALSLAHVERWKEALAEADALAKRADLSAEGCWNVARVYALSSTSLKKDAPLAEEHAARAVRLLQRAADASYFAAAARVEQLRWERDLTALQGREDFARLLQRLTKNQGQKDR